MPSQQQIDDQLKKIKDEVLACQKCSLRQERDKSKFYPVIGKGNHQAKIFLCGEAPGLSEAKTARPFCGAAGRILDELLVSIGIKREEVYISNIIKDRPPDNRDPLPEEIKACSPYVLRQLEIIKPRVICPLGRYSMKFLMEKFNLGDAVEPISKIHGKSFKAEAPWGAINIIPFYHPAVATYHPAMKETLKKDFQILKDF